MAAKAKPVKWLFPEPEVGSIKPAKPVNVNPPSYMNREVIMDQNNVHTLVRTGGSRHDQGCEEVRTISTRLIPSYSEPAGGIRYRCPRMRPTYVQVNDYIRDMRLKGYGVGAIVTRRHISVEAMISNTGWGMILQERKAVPFNGIAYDPYIVKWFQTDKAEGTWAEDLLIIMPSLPRDELISMIADQVEQDHEESGND